MTGQDRRLGFGDAQVAANLAREKVVDLGVARKGGGLVVRWIPVDRVVRTLAPQYATVRAQVPQEVAPLHEASTNGSRITSWPAPCSRAISRFVSSTRTSASRRFSRASSCVCPLEFTPGRSSM